MTCIWISWKNSLLGSQIKFCSCSAWGPGSEHGQSDLKILYQSRQVLGCNLIQQVALKMLDGRGIKMTCLHTLYAEYKFLQGNCAGKWWEKNVTLLHSCLTLRVLIFLSAAVTVTASIHIQEDKGALQIADQIQDVCCDKNKGWGTEMPLLPSFYFVPNVLSQMHLSGMPRPETLRCIFLLAVLMCISECNEYWLLFQHCLSILMSAH